MAESSSSQQRIERVLAGRRHCITGGAGFIGAAIAEALLRLGCDVVIIDDLSSGSLDRVANLLDRFPEQLHFINASILDPPALRDAIKNSDTVFHLAAIASLQESTDDPRRCYEVNVTGTVRLAEVARKLGVSRLIYAGSSGAYGLATPPHSESIPPQPLSPYAASKLAGEYVVAAWDRCYGLPGMRLRLFNVVGPGQRADSPYAAVVPAFARKLLAGEAPVIHGDGSQTRDFVPIGDVVRAFLLAASTDTPLRGDVVNIGSGRATTILSLCETITRLCNRENIKPAFDSPREGDVPHSFADITRARKLIGFEPSSNLDQALTDAIEWLSNRDNQTTASA